MAVKFKPVGKQVVVIIGAASGIGRVCALRFAKRGAKLVLAARDAVALATLAEEIVSQGGEAVFLACDASIPADMEAVARLAEERFGRVDTWVNDAAVAVYARFWETTPEEFRRVMEVNYLGQVHGALAALPALRRAGGGALIAISSVESIVSLPLHTAYSASKHAVEGAMDGLRRELMAEGAPISVTSVKPGTINTPFFSNARNNMDVMPKGPSPIYDPNVVADCVLFAAEHPVRDLYAGGAARMMAAAQFRAPGLVDRILARAGIPASRTEQPEPGGAEGNLYEPHAEGRTQGDFSKQARRFSAYTWLETHPKAKLFLLGGAVTGAAALARARRSRTNEASVKAPTNTAADMPALPLPHRPEALVIESEDVAILVTAPA